MKEVIMKLGTPRLGIYSSSIKAFLEGLGVEIIMPPRITRDMIKLGVANSPDMICFPFKYTLGQQIWALEQGATDILMFSSCGICRQKHYHEIQEHILNGLGYKFKMHVFTSGHISKMLKEVGKVSRLQAHRTWRKIYAAIERLEKQAYSFSPDRDLNIGIVGEIGTMLEPDINFDIVRRLQRRGVNVHMSLTIANYLSKKTNLGKREEKETRKLLSQELGGHGFESIANTIYYGKNGFDGVIHLLPLSCMPESTVEPLMDMMAEKYSIPLYRFPMDESNFEAGIKTRVDTFISMLRRRKGQR